MNKFIYAGIGSRSTPGPVMEQMTKLGSILAANWILRSGHADGADIAFEFGALSKNGELESYLPWRGFNRADMRLPWFKVPDITKEQLAFAASFHPNWNACNTAAKTLHARNLNQIAGEHLDTPCNMVVCWTKNGEEVGGTATAIKAARYLNIPVFNLANEGALQAVCDFVTTLENQ